MKQSWELRGSSWDVLLKHHLVWLRATGLDCCVEWDTQNNCMTTWQSQECLRLSGSNTCGNDSAREVFVVPVWIRQLKLSTSVCWEATSCFLAVPKHPLVPVWIPAVLRRADEAHEPSPSLLFAENAHSWNHLALTMGCSLWSFSEIIQVSQDNQYMLRASWFFSPRNSTKPIYIPT